MKYELRYGDGVKAFKTIEGLELSAANRLFKRAKRFAEKHNLTWVLAIWDSDGWLIKSETINPTGIIGE